MGGKLIEEQFLEETEFDSEKSLSEGVALFLSMFCDPSPRIVSQTSIFMAPTCSIGSQDTDPKKQAELFQEIGKFGLRSFQEDFIAESELSLKSTAVNMLVFYIDKTYNN